MAHITMENFCFIAVVKGLFVEINRKGIEGIAEGFRIIQSATVTFEFEFEFGLL